MKKGLVINEDVWPLIDDLLPEEKAALLTALSAYYRGDELPTMERIVCMVFNRITIDNARFDPANKKSLSEIRAEAGRKGAESRWHTVANVANDGKNGKLPQDKIREEKKREDKDEKRECLLPPELDQDYVRDALKDFKDMRQRIRRPMTQRAEELIIKDLVKLSQGDPLTAKRILEQSTKNSWQGVFALKASNGAKPKIDWGAI